MGWVVNIAQPKEKSSHRCGIKSTFWPDDAERHWIGSRWKCRKCKTVWEINYMQLRRGYDGDFYQAAWKKVSEGETNAI